MKSSGTGRHVLIVVQNLPVPLDRRVWLECRALVEAGYRVSVICPKGPGDPAYAELDGVRLYKYKPAPPAAGRSPPRSLSRTARCSSGPHGSAPPRGSLGSRPQPVRSGGGCGASARSSMP